MSRRSPRFRGIVAWSLRGLVGGYGSRLRTRRHMQTTMVVTAITMSAIAHGCTCGLRLLMTSTSTAQVPHKRAVATRPTSDP
jgi:hypothetical protein